MPREALPLEGGYDVQQDEYGSTACSQLVNLMAGPGSLNRSRPGLRSFSTATPAEATIGGIFGFSVNTDTTPQIIGLAEYLDRLVAVDGNRRVYTFDSAGACVDGTQDPLPGKDVPRFLVDDDGRLIIFGGGAPLVMGSDFVARLFFDANGTQPNATHGAIVDRYLLVNERGTDRVFYAPVDDHTMIQPDYFIRCGSRADAAAAIVELNNQLWAFGRESVEYWYGTGDGPTGDPFKIERALPTEFGLGPIQSLIKADNTLWWMDRQRRIVRLEGLAPKVVSLPIERQIEAFGSVDDCVAQFVEISGKHFVAMTFQAARTTLMYDLVESAWSEWRRWDGSYWSAMPLQAYARQRQWNRHFCGAQTSSGAVLELSASTYTDLGSSIRRVRRLPFVDHGQLRTKHVHHVRMLCKRGVATDFATDAQTGDPRIELRWRNEGQAWSTPRRLSLGQVGDNDVTLESRILGSYVRRQYEIECSTPTEVSFSRMEEDFDPGVD